MKRTDEPELKSGKCSCATLDSWTANPQEENRESRENLASYRENNGQSRSEAGVWAALHHIKFVRPAARRGRNLGDFGVSPGEIRLDGESERMSEEDGLTPSDKDKRALICGMQLVMHQEQ